MDKLIEILDEYRKQNPREFFWDDGSLVVLTWKDFIELNRLIIISKEYWFIKWLVDNDKIDLEKIWGNESPDIFDYSFYEVVLMLLSIQDNPIEFLISILK